MLYVTIFMIFFAQAGLNQVRSNPLNAQSNVLDCTQNGTVVSASGRHSRFSLSAPPVNYGAIEFRRAIHVGTSTVNSVKRKCVSVLRDLKRGQLDNDVILEVLNHAQSLDRQGQSGCSLSFYTAIIETLNGSEYPNERSNILVHVFLAMGELQVRVKQKMEAVESFFRATQHAPTSSVAHHNLAVMLMKAGYPEGFYSDTRSIDTRPALHHLTAALMLDSENPETWFSLGDLSSGFSIPLPSGFCQKGVITPAALEHIEENSTDEYVQCYKRARELYLSQPNDSGCKTKAFYHWEQEDEVLIHRLQRLHSPTDYIIEYHVVTDKATRFVTESYCHRNLHVAVLYDAKVLQQDLTGMITDSIRCKFYTLNDHIFSRVHSFDQRHFSPTRKIHLSSACSTLQSFGTQFYHYTWESLFRLIFSMPYLEENNEMSIILPGRTRYINDFVTVVGLGRLDSDRLVFAGKRDEISVDVLYIIDWRPPKGRESQFVRIVPDMWVPHKSVRRVRKRLSPVPVPEHERKYVIWISRNKDSTQARTVLNEDELLTAIQKALPSHLQLAIFHGSHSRIQGSIRLFEQAKVVIGVMSSALSNILFCPPGSSLLEVSLPDRSFYGFFRDHAAALGMRYFIVEGISKGLYTSPVEIPISNVVKALRHALDMG